jgi:hypothetical protein
MDGTLPLAVSGNASSVPPLRRWALALACAIVTRRGPGRSSWPSTAARSRPAQTSASGSPSSTSRRTDRAWPSRGASAGRSRFGAATSGSTARSAGGVAWGRDRGCSGPRPPCGPARSHLAAIGRSRDGGRLSPRRRRARVIASAAAEWEPARRPVLAALRPGRSPKWEPVRRWGRFRPRRSRTRGRLRAASRP